jgi:hypothetical protein
MTMAMGGSMPRVRTLSGDEYEVVYSRHVPWAPNWSRRSGVASDIKRDMRRRLRREAREQILESLESELD